jgi:hypothetical protein
MILLHNPGHFVFSALSPDEIQRITEGHRAWIERQRAEGRVTASDQLADSGRTLVADGSVKDGPFAEGKEVIGGYYVIEASGYDEAERIARELFELGAHHGTIEVRELMVH